LGGIAHQFNSSSSKGNIESVYVYEVCWSLLVPVAAWGTPTKFIIDTQNDVLEILSPFNILSTMPILGILSA